VITLTANIDTKIGFPTPLLGNAPLRLPVAEIGEGLLALALPGGLLSEAHPFYGKRVSVIAALQAQLRASKPELERLGLEVAKAINFIEPEVSGLLLVGINKAGVEQWRNVFGSRQLTFTYEFVAAANPELPGELVCELPIARHKQEARMLISHKTGKKSRTAFQRIAEQEGYCLWEAKMDLPRMHQVRLHAAEVGLAIPGEQLYGQCEQLTWAALKGRSARGQVGVIVDRPLIHLARIEGGAGFSEIEAAVEGPMGRLWQSFVEVA